MGALRSEVLRLRRALRKLAPDSRLQEYHHAEALTFMEAVGLRHQPADLKIGREDVPFGTAMTMITHRTVDKAFEIYLCLYQAVTGTEEERPTPLPRHVEDDSGPPSVRRQRLPWAVQDCPDRLVHASVLASSGRSGGPSGFKARASRSRTAIQSSRLSVAGIPCRCTSL